MDSQLILFVKHPVPGQVKTRLAKTVGHEKALKVYHLLLQRTQQQAERVQADKIVWYGNEIPADDLWAQTGWNRKLQHGPDLGARMELAFQEAFDQGITKAVIIGSDCPGITTELLETAFQQLETHDAVIGPANDGGYYLLGLTRMVPEVFREMEWSTETVFETTVKRLAAAGFQAALLPELVDVDTEADLHAVKHLLPL
ncbi:MAG: TIGR04282 family arsenosugar biosynthesis glycosyltransferase [Bacteroidota bacterium]